MSQQTPQSILVILPAQAGEAASVSPETALLGLPLSVRIARAAEMAGFSAIVPGGSSLPPGRIVFLSSSVLPKSRWLASLRQMPIERGKLYAVGDLAAVIETEEPGGTLALPEAGELTLDRLLVSRSNARIDDPGGEAERISISGPSDLPRAEKWLLAGLVKQEEGFMSRHVERRISLAISRRLAATRVTPNAMTLVSVAVGLAGASLFLFEATALQFAGALLFLLHSILDGCDGELARLKFQESRFGGVLDFWGDNVVHSAVFGAIAVGWSRALGLPWPLVLGAAAILGTLLSAGFIHRFTMAQAPEVALGPLFTSVSPARATRLSRLADLLARRDFIYLVVLLSAFGKARWFLVLGAVGAPLFFLSLLAITWGKRVDPARSPA